MCSIAILNYFTHHFSQGLYMYVEASGQSKGAKSQLVSFPIKTALGEPCTVLFYYSMNGQGEGALNVYARPTSTNISHLQWSVRYDQGIGWKQAMIDLSNGNEELVLVFEGLIFFQLCYC